MSVEAGQPRIIWATRGRLWGFRFLLDGGVGDPLPTYERTFGELRDAPSAWRREGACVALRILDPLGRRDAAGRVIPHEFVVFGELANAVDSVESGMRVVWPLVADAYADVWEAANPPTTEDLHFGAS